MTLRQRFLGAFVLIIVLAVSLSVAVGYRSAQQQLAAFVTEIDQIEAKALARRIGQAYSAADGWATIDTALTHSHHESVHAEEHATDSNHDDQFHIEQIRVVVVDTEGVIVADNFGKLSAGTLVPTLDGHQTPIIDERNNQAVGVAFVDVNQQFLSAESRSFLQTLLQNSALGGLLIAATAFGLAFWLLRRIIAPVTALTAATQMLAINGDATLLPVTSADELGQMSAAFNTMTTALQTQRTLRRRLINDVAHELNTPLSVIQLEAHGLCEGYQVPLEAGKQIIQEIDLLRNLVSDLNWLAETDSGEQKIVREPCDLAQLLTDETKRWQPHAQSKQITLDLVTLPTLPTLQLDRKRMQQALGNVIRNAMQHTEINGAIVISAEVDTAQLTISVKDDGVGINSADLPHLLDRFYRADRSRSRSSGGVGLGLAIAHAIVTAHGGKITISSDGIGTGATITLQLPI